MECLAARVSLGTRVPALVGVRRNVLRDVLKECRRLAWVPVAGGVPLMMRVHLRRGKVTGCKMQGCRVVLISHQVSVVILLSFVDVLWYAEPSRRNLAYTNLRGPLIYGIRGNNLKPSFD